MGNFAENLNLGNCVRPPLTDTESVTEPSVDHYVKTLAKSRQ